MRFVEFTWLVISLASQMGAEQSLLWGKIRDIKPHIVRESWRASKRTGGIDFHGTIAFQNLHGSAAGYLACFSLDPGRAKGRPARTQGFRCSASSFPAATSWSASTRSIPSVLVISFLGKHANQRHAHGGLGFCRMVRSRLRRCIHSELFSQI